MEVVMVVVVRKVGRSLLEWVADQRSGGYRNELSRQDSFCLFFDLDFYFPVTTALQLPPSDAT